MIDRIVRLEQGVVRGAPSKSGEALAFLGIPYAAPPVGPLRWRPPQPLEVVTDILDASRFGSIPIQPPAPAASIFPPPAEPQSEDCLYLNIWTGAAEADERRSVIVWLYPGAFQVGAGSAPLYDGEGWARAGAVLVTLNFRLSRLGFLAHPELCDESPEGIAGNYGLLDQIAALRWVRDNIAAFGGDPGCVTLFGISSGATSVSLLMTCPQAQGLFHRVISESGGSFGPRGERTGIGDRWQALPDALRSGEAWAAELGMPRLADLRDLDADRIRAASRPDRHEVKGAFDGVRPIIDGRLVPSDSFALFAAGRQAAVPLLVGCAADEDLGATFSPDLASYLKQACDEQGADASEFLDLYPAASDTEAVAAGLRSAGHRVFTWQNWTGARLHAHAGHQVYYYRFARRPPVPADQYIQQQLPRPIGAFHGASIFYTFQNFGQRPDWTWCAWDRELSRIMVEAWLSFARTGRPQAQDLPRWPTFDPDRPSVMSFGDECGLRDVPERPFLHFWDRFYART